MLSRYPTLRRRARHLLREARYAITLFKPPPRVAAFHCRARRLATRTGDRFSLASATRPSDLIVLLELARGRRVVVELGTATAWTTVALALDDPRREVISYDPFEQPGRASYLALAGPDVLARVTLVAAPGSSGPRDDRTVDLLYIDSSHQLEETVAEVRAWQPALRPGSLIVLDDYVHPEFPGVRQAVQQLRLAGEQRGTLYVHRV